jgi:hypothetical protein
MRSQSPRLAPVSPVSYWQPQALPFLRHLPDALRAMNGALWRHPLPFRVRLSLPPSFESDSGKCTIERLL